MQSDIRRARLLWFAGFVALTALEVVIALFVHDRFIRPYLGDMIVVWVVYSFVRAVLWPLAPPRLLPLYVFAFAALVELSQLFGLVNALGLSGNRLFSILLGGTFDVADLLCYAVSCVCLFVVQKVSAKT